jgi:hypothetical protein
MELTPLAPTRSRKQNRTTSGTGWTTEEDDLLRRLVSESESVSWCVIAKFFPNKTAPQIAGRWDKVIDPRLIKGCWTREEDEAILKFVEAHGNKDWAKLAVLLEGRTGKQCRERYRNHLDTSVNHYPWTAEEDSKLAKLHDVFGNSWTKLASFFEGRSDNCIKNRWNSTVKKRLERIEAGQPLVMKRGRKPKAITPSEPEAMSCSSPVEEDNGKVAATVRFELIPLNPTLRAKFSAHATPCEVVSLEQSRNELQRLLTGLPV